MAGHKWIPLITSNDTTCLHVQLKYDHVSAITKLREEKKDAI